MGQVNHSCRVSEEDLGPYLLGQLPSGRAEEVAAEVASCPSCAAEVARLRPVVTAMTAASAPEDLGRRTAPLADPSSLAEVLASVRRAQRSRSRRRAAIAAGGLAAAVALGAAVPVFLGAGEQDRRVALARSGAASPESADATASMVLSERGWGTAIKLEVSGLRPEQTYGVWLERREGGRLPAGSFRPDDDGTVQISLSSALDLSDSAAVGVAVLPGGVVADAVDVLSADLG